MNYYEERNKGALSAWRFILGGLALWVIVGVAWGLANPNSDDDPKPPPPTPWLTFSVPPVAPYTGPITVCTDGWVSHSTGRGTCSHHGGERY